MVEVCLGCVAGSGGEQLLNRFLQVAFAVDEELTGDHDVFAFVEAGEDLEPSVATIETQLDIARRELQVKRAAPQAAISPGGGAGAVEMGATPDRRAP